MKQNQQKITPYSVTNFLYSDVSFSYNLLQFESYPINVSLCIQVNQIVTRHLFLVFCYLKENKLISLNNESLKRDVLSHFGSSEY